MSKTAITPFQRNLEHWEIMNMRHTIASVGNNITAEISQHRKKMVEAANKIIVSQERIAEGIEEVSMGIDRLSDGLESLAAAFNWGFSEIVWQLEQERGLLVDIKNILEAPLDTQAKELRKRAEEAYKNDWMEDALADFLESEKNNRYDFVVHQYLGNIYFFEKKNPDKALWYYEKALKYSIPRSPYHASFALLHIGLIKRLQEDFQKALESTSQAIELTPNLYEAHYQHAQYCSILGRYDDAIKHLKKAICGDLNYLIRADREEDFSIMKKQLLALFEEFRNIFKNLAQEEINKAQEFVQDAKSYGANDYTSSSKIFRSAKDNLEKARSYFKWDSIFDYYDSYFFAKQGQNEAVDSLIESLSHQISDTQSEYREEFDKNKKKKTKLLVWSFWISPLSFIISWIVARDCFFAFGLSLVIFIILIICSQTSFRYKKVFEEKLTNLSNKMSESQEIKNQMNLKEEMVINIEEYFKKQGDEEVRE